MKKNGFTLIELVVVIVILGILAITTVPRFLNLQSDTRKSALQGLKGAMDSAAGIVYGQAAIEGKETDAAQTLKSGVKTDFGYPSAHADGLVKAVTGLDDDWAWATQTILASASGPSNTLVVTFVSNDLTAGENKNAFKIINTKCYVAYTAAQSVGKEANTKIINMNC